MKHLILLALAVAIFISCNPEPDATPNPADTFTQELEELKAYFAIPGLSVVIAKGEDVVYENYLGFADVDKQLKVDSATAFPIASITKLYSATLVLKLAEQGKLTLDDPIHKYLPESALDSTILIKHLLSHTSEGNIGQQFHYSSRFGLLTQIIEQASGQSYKALMQQEILNPLNLKNTFLMEDSLPPRYQQLSIARPYVLDGETQPGFIDYGYSAAAGLVCTPGELLEFSRAWDNHSVINPDSKQKMVRGLSPDLPYGYGLFRQEVEGLEVQWVYGQYDCYSSLLLKVPAKDLTLILLANNNLMSDPARLIMGDVMSSLFAISFLKNYALDLQHMPLLEEPDSVYNSNYPLDFYRKKVLAQALAESFMARFEPEKLNTSAQLLEETFKRYPNVSTYADINLLHNLSFLKDVAFYMELGAFNQFDPQLEAIGINLLLETRNDPYVHAYLGTYFDRKDDVKQAAIHFKAIEAAENFAINWYTRDAASWLESHR